MTAWRRAAPDWRYRSAAFVADRAWVGIDHHFRPVAAGIRVQINRHHDAWNVAYFVGMSSSSLAALDTPAVSPLSSLPVTSALPSALAPARTTSIRMVGHRVRLSCVIGGAWVTRASRALGARGWRFAPAIGRFGEGWAGTAQPFESHRLRPNKKKWTPAGESIFFCSGGDGGIRTHDTGISRMHP